LGSVGRIVLRVTGLRMLVLTLRFAVEIAMLVGLAYAGARLGEGAVAWLLGIGLPLGAILVWQTFVAPKARRPVTTSTRIGIEAALFGGTVILLAAAGQGTLALIFALVAAIVSAATAATQGIPSPFDEPH
jgi:hypothetical protein